jgi:hypothetical protein
MILNNTTTWPLLFAIPEIAEYVCCGFAVPLLLQHQKIKREYRCKIRSCPRNCNPVRHGGSAFVLHTIMARSAP